MLDIIFNPSAGGKNGKKIFNCIEKIKARLTERGVEFALHPACKKGETKSLTSKLISEGATDLVIVGGDGTLHAAINGFHSFERVNMGIIPCGTGNDFAHALNIPKDPVKAIDLIVDGEAKFTDFMQLPGVRGLNVAGMGIDVEVLKRYERLKKKTKFGYTLCLIKTLFKFGSIKFSAEAKTQNNVINKDYNSFIAAVANGSVFGGGIPICPKADPTDNCLDFIAVKSMNKLSLIGAFLKLKAGKILRLKQTTHIRAESFNILSETPCTINVDGELYDNILFNVEIVSNKLKIYR